MRKRIGSVLLSSLMVGVVSIRAAEEPQGRAEATLKPLAALGSGSGALNGSTTTAMDGRFDFTASPTNACGAAEAGLGHYYDAIPFTSDANGNATLLYSGECSERTAFDMPLSHVTIHTAPFDPSSICTNFVWGMAAGTATPQTFSVPPSTPLVMVVSAYVGGPDVNCTYSYSLNSTPAVPSMGHWPMMALAGLLAAGGAWIVRRRRARPGTATVFD